jgi:tetratricopeptide (TPR) repeat protein
MDEAIGEYKEAIRINPIYGIAHHGLGIAYLEQGKYYDAIAEFKNAFSNNMLDNLARYHAGTAYQALGILLDAICAYDAFVRSATASGDTYFLSKYIAYVKRAEEIIINLQQQIKGET